MFFGFSKNVKNVKNVTT